MPFQLIKELFVDIRESFYTNIAYQFFLQQNNLCEFHNTKNLLCTQKPVLNAYFKDF